MSLHHEKKQDEGAKEKSEVNPAARRDRPDEAGPVPGDRRRSEQSPVRPVQEEPLDPLGPGGIGG